MSKKSKKEEPENISEETVDHEEQVEDQENEQTLQIQALEQEVITLKDSLLRKAAELENVRKRVQRERVALYEEAKVSALEDFLAVNDDLLRTLDASIKMDVDASFLDGLKLVASKFSEIFSKNNIEAIDTVDVPFDVNLHDALLRQPAPNDETPSNTVLQILERGYKMGNKTISHAKVIVSE